MQFYKFNSPSDWNGYVDIDKELNLEEINMAEGIFDEEEEVQKDENMKEAQEDGTKSKNSQYKKGKSQTSSKEAKSEKTKIIDRKIINNQ